MKAVFCPKYGLPEVLQLRDIEKPIPKDHEILVKIRATTVTVADVRIRSFTIPTSFWVPARIVLGIRKPKNPVLGVELSGEVESMGKNVAMFKKGDAVFAAALKNFGAYAEYICLPESGVVAIKPPQITYEEAAALPIGARTALHYLKKGNVQRGQKLLIYGASGSVGTYAIQLAKYFGAEVTGICSSKNFDLVNSLGADKVIDYTNKNFTENLEKYDMIFVAVDKLPFYICKNHLKEEGVYVNITAPVKSPSMLWASISGKMKIFVGENSAESAEDLGYLMNLVEEGILKVVIDRSYSLNEIVEAHRYVEKGHKKGNVVIKVS